jgi:hypothetical protein
MDDPQPSVGRIVHYVSHGTPGGEYASECRAAIITEVSSRDCNDAPIGLSVFSPQGVMFNQHVHHDEDTKAGGTWHWPERV